MQGCDGALRHPLTVRPQTWGRGARRAAAPRPVAALCVPARQVMAAAAQLAAFRLAFRAARGLDPQNGASVEWEGRENQDVLSHVRKGETREEEKPEARTGGTVVVQFLETRLLVPSSTRTRRAICTRPAEHGLPSQGGNERAGARLHRCPERVRKE